MDPGRIYMEFVVDDDMVILYDWGPSKSLVYTEKHGYLPRFEWLSDQAEQMRQRGRRVELVMGEGDRAGQSALFVDKKHIVKKV